MRNFISSNGGGYYSGDRESPLDVEVSARPSTEHRWNGKQWVIDTEKMSQAVNQAREKVGVEPVVFGGHLFDADAASKTKVFGAVAAVAVGIPLPDGFYWTSSDNVDVPMDAEGLKGLAGAMFERENSIHQHSRALKIAAAAGNVININEGWPK